ncbi:AAA family ATPase [Rhodococcus sp. AD45-ID]|uniref:UvrD-helicase domain-containing protein n=1 Tax=unclassified Rhodococcus (in: high G+C Gram-positive bacteria) TaxID=192944 RepID=UPI0005D32FC2|nr:MULTISPECIES: UvrD-helicase domain-containing protein [unclassified Rhodococcus (in: high G+C Gram-positive bacteria)]KJF20774.1 Exodeoxyribonuclease V beta chain [Rhodococcus sp. AD45]PSR38357.1 AAA family ATPase [Rhodococcus sp. AD45-ID]
MDFDLLGPLPSGTTVLEASAGTGKTYAIVGLATRCVAEGVADISQVLLVTFSRAATQELRERTRERFAGVSAALADPDRARHSDDVLIRHLASAGDEELARRRRRLLQALAEFDSGTMTTTHSFCQRMLDGLGIAGEREPDATFVESVDDLIDEVVSDLYLVRYSALDTSPPFSVKDALAIARSAVADGQAVLEPDADEDTIPGQRVLFAAAARDEVERRKRARGIRDFNDLLTLLHGVLADPDYGQEACRRVREKFRVVLIDEFQDTDPLQWDILRLAFHGHTTLVLVGDPKQAIYAFRGAEVLSYLDAVQQADSHQELTTNWRSDPGLLAALEHLYGGAALGNDSIVAHPVASSHKVSRLPGQPSMRLRYLPRTGAGPLNRSQFPAVGRLRSRIADDLAADVVRVLSSGSELSLGGVSRPVVPGDIAVLVRNHKQAEMIRGTLELVGVPSVLTGGSSVFATASAKHWLWLLQAVEQPHRADRVRLAALSPILGHTPEAMDSDGDAVVAAVSGQLRMFAELFQRIGFAAVFEKISGETGLERRILSSPSGERDFTDLRHVAQLLGRVAAEESFGLSALVRWLGDRIKDPASGSVSDRSRRLDSDAAAVQIATVHASKGLEFPIVYVPFGWDSVGGFAAATQMLHDGDGRRILDVGGAEGPGYNTRKLTAETEGAGEELRLLYVALTRAQCQLVLWWAPAYGTSRSALHRLLLGRTPGIVEPARVVKVLDDGAIATRLESWPADRSDVISVESVGPHPPSVDRWSESVSETYELEAARFDRDLDTLWRRTSYSALTAGAHHAPTTGSEVEDPGKDDEPADFVDVGPVEASPLEALPSPMNGLPAGAAFGTLVHEILEVVDTSAVDLRSELEMRCAQAVSARAADLDPVALANALFAVMHTPLGFGTLATIDPSDRLPELDFELPLAGGDDPVSLMVTLRQVAELLRKHLPHDDILAGYADHLGRVDAIPMRGFLTGSIDAVLRIPGPSFVIVDYKTNRLGRGDLTAAHYTRDLMAAEMIRSHYPLQALLYSVALHRYLRWRLADYDPGRHLGGAQYQFVRGMLGPESPPECGVFEWKPPAALIVELSDLLAGRSSPDVLEFS